jgi:thiol:disulfide interchange protein DsbC
MSQQRIAHPPTFALLVLCSLTAGPAKADEAKIVKAIEGLAGPGARVESIRPAGFLGLYEVRLGGELLYTDAQGRYAVLGRVIDTKTGRDLTQERRLELARAAFAELPLELAAKQATGKGRRVLVTFEDPNCPYCRKLAQELERLDDLTVYTFLLPILTPDSTEKARAIWCAKDRGRAWRDWILDGKMPAGASCDAPLERLLALGERHAVAATPTILLPDGNRIDGYAPANQIEQALERAPGP